MQYQAQLEGFFTKSFHDTIRKDMPRWMRLTVLVLGHIGFLGRAGVFLFVCILFFRTVRDNKADYVRPALASCRTSEAANLFLCSNPPCLCDWVALLVCIALSFAEDVKWLWVPQEETQLS